VEGIPESDKGARGGLCAKGVAGILDCYDQNRILYPVKRTNPQKGLYEDPKWERISWEEALGTISEKLVQARKKDPRSVVWTFTPRSYRRNEVHDNSRRISHHIWYL
jgi:anaerobic selenocysteine-containing dehydrogenase